MDLIQNQRKEFYLVNKGYLFVKEKDLSDGRSFWKCKENGQSRKSCRVRLHCIDYTTLFIQHYFFDPSRELSK